jgi:hypothetical protein
MGYLQSAGKNISKAAAPVARTVALTAHNPVLGAAYGAAAFSDANRGGKNYLKGNLYGKTKGSEAGPAKPEDNWWKQDRPESRREITNPDGTLKNAYSLQAQQINAPASRIGELDNRMNNVQGVNFANVGNIGAGAALAGLSARSISNDLSPQAQARMNLADAERGRSMDSLNKNAAGAASGAMSQLAASGGMDSGARSRMASDAMKARMSGASGIYNQTGINKANIGIQDLGNQYDLQTRMPEMFMNYGRNQMVADQFNSNLGMEKVGMYRDQARGEDDRSFIAARDNADNNLRANQFNVQNAIADKSASDAWDMERWKTQNAARAGQFTADSQNYYAQQQGKRGLLGNNGGLLGTGLGA